MLDQNGFVKKAYSQIVDEMEAKAKELFGEDVNTKAYTPLGIILRIFAWFHSILWDVVEKVYNNSFPGTAEGVSLWRLGKLKGITPLVADYSHGEIRITGKPREVIAAGLVVGTESNILFETTHDCTLDSLGVGTTEIYAQETGATGNVEPGTITVVVFSDADIYSVTNLASTEGGRDLETDAEFYERFQKYPERSGSSNTESIEAKLLETSGVRDAIVSQNTTMIEQNGLPPKCIAPFVFGGNDQDVAQAIFSVAGGGVEVFGDTIVQVTDSKGNVHDIGFTRPSTLQVYVRVALTKGTNFPSDGLKIVQNQVLSYIGGTDDVGNDYPGLGLKQNVVHAKLVAIILNVQGVEDALVELSTDAVNYIQGNIVIDSNQVAKTTDNKVVVV